MCNHLFGVGEDLTLELKNSTKILVRVYDRFVSVLDEPYYTVFELETGHMFHTSESRLYD